MYFGMGPSVCMMHELMVNCISILGGVLDGVLLYELLFCFLGTEVGCKPRRSRSTLFETSIECL